MEAHGLNSLLKGHFPNPLFFMVNDVPSHISADFKEIMLIHYLKVISPGGQILISAPI